MDNILKSVFDLPDISFIENDTLDAMMHRLVSNYEKRYKEVTGQTVSLGAADPARIQLYAIALDLYQIEQYVDRAGKQDLLKYSYDSFLDNLAGNRGVTRQQAAAARTTIRFTLSAVRDYAIGIPAGTRLTNGDGVYFQTSEYTEAPAGSSYVDVEAECTAQGIEGNNFLPGQINILVDPLPYVESVANTTTTAGGTDLEDDRSLAERTFLAPSGYSTAGPQDAYTYWTKTRNTFWVRTYNTDIGSVRPTTPEPGKVTVYILMQDGTLPGAEVIDGLQDFLAQEEIRPMTDLVTVSAPEVKTFDISLTYYIARSNQASATTIQEKVAAAVQDFITWQTTEIGRDLNPTELIRRVQEAGAKRVVLEAPDFAVISETQVAQLGTKAVAYGGMEDD